MLDEINNQIASRGGRWVNLRSKADGILDGVIVSAEPRGKTFEGAPVVSRKSGQQRTEWVFTLQTDKREDDDDDGIRKSSFNESAQGAISAAVKASASRLEAGGHLRIGVVEDAPAGERVQATYKAKYEAPKAAAVTDPSDLI